MSTFPVRIPGTTLSFDGETIGMVSGGLVGVLSGTAAAATVLRGGDASTTTWASTMTGGGADAEYAPYQILRGGDASGT